VRVLLAQLSWSLITRKCGIDETDAVIKKTAGENEACRWLLAIPGIGPVTSTAVIAAIGKERAIDATDDEEAANGFGSRTAKEEVIGLLGVPRYWALPIRTRKRPSVIWLVAD